LFGDELLTNTEQGDNQQDCRIVDEIISSLLQSYT